MAKPADQITTKRPGIGVQESRENIAVSQSGNTELVVINTLELERLFVQIEVAGQALDAFGIQARATLLANNEPSTLFSTSQDFTSPIGLLVGASGDLTTLAAGATGWFILDVSALAEITLYASSGNAAGSTVAVYVGGGV